MGTDKLSVAVIGGGIGGLHAALSLLKAGFDVHVYERARELREVGAGIVLTPNAVRIIHGLGLAAELEALGVAVPVVRQRRWEDGRTLLLANVGPQPGAPAMFYTSHRSDVLMMLAGALPAQRLHLGHKLTGFADSGDRVDMRFENGARAAADIMIGADGIHSTVREKLFGTEHPRFTGCVAYRGLVPAEKLKHLDLPLEDQLWLGRDALAAYDGWHRQVRDIISSVEETFVWGLFDRAPLPRWSVNRVTLLGDACHPMLPFLAQGAAQAIEDGATLAGVLAGSRGPVEALRRYEALRRPRTALIQTTAGGNKTRNHLADGSEQVARDAAMASGAADWSIGASLWVYQHDAAAAAQTGALGLPA